MSRWRASLHGGDSNWPAFSRAKRRRTSTDCSRVGGELQRRMSAVFASYQTDQISIDIKGGNRRRVESGLPLGRHYGLRFVRVNGRSLVEHDPVNATKVRRIFELFAKHIRLYYEILATEEYRAANGSLPRVNEWEAVP